jgi:putative transposase
MEVCVKKKRFTEEQIAYALAQESSGQTIAEICRPLGVCEQTFYRWKKKYGSMGLAEVRRLKQLEEENVKLKRLVADLSLDKAILQDLRVPSDGALRVGEAWAGGSSHADPGDRSGAPELGLAADPRAAALRRGLEHALLPRPAAGRAKAARGVPECARLRIVRGCRGNMDFVAARLQCLASTQRLGHADPPRSSLNSVRGT